MQLPLGRTESVGLSPRLDGQAGHAETTMRDLQGCTE